MIKNFYKKLLWRASFTLLIGSSSLIATHTWQVNHYDITEGTIQSIDYKNNVLPLYNFFNKSWYKKIVYLMYIGILHDYSTIPFMDYFDIVIWYKKLKFNLNFACCSVIT